MTSDRGLTVFFMRYAMRHKRLFIFSFIMMPLYAWLLAAAPKVMQSAVDEGILKGNIPLTVRSAFIYLGCILGAFVAVVLQNWAMQAAGIRTLNDLREAVMAHISKLGKDQFETRPLGVYVSRATSDIEAIGETMTAGLTNLVSDGLLIIFIFVHMSMMNLRLGMMTLVLVPIIVIIVDIFRRILRPLYDQIRTLNGTLTARINETLTMLFELRNFNLRKPFSDRYDETNRQFRDTTIRAISYDALVFSILEGLSFVSIGAVLLVVGGRAVGGTEVLQIGVIVAYIQWLQLLFPPIKQMGSRFAVLQSAFAAVSKVNQIMALPLPEDSGDATPENADLSVRDLSFSYKKGEPVLRGLDVQVPAGGSLAVVGPTGAGKSTLIRLLVRQYELEQGLISIGGKPLTAIPREALKKLIVLVPQEPSIFRESVAYNISLNRPEVTRESIVEICRKIHAHAFIERLPGGYDSVLESEGANLSMGQRQLIALARALASDARILIFDEATANIDSETEILIQQALAYVMREKTTILIAHRLSTIRDAGHIIVLSQGQIVEQGTHQELLTSDGLYRRMYELQA
ncbi:MAG: ATP-binding cassette subfamily B multidrug efflux pump [Rhodothermales bacterium]|jgi:ATP-binding cassette subfamily B multidrug efflux pump